MGKQVKISLEIYGQTFNIRAEPGEEKNLKRVAEEVDKFMCDLARRNTVPIHRLALMAAFHYAYEMDTLKNSQDLGSEKSSEIYRKFDEVLDKLQSALDEE